jgi:hypothetical protein
VTLTKDQEVTIGVNGTVDLGKVKIEVEKVPKVPNSELSWRRYHRR